MTPNQKKNVRKISDYNFKRRKTRHTLPEPTHKEIDTAVNEYLNNGGMITQEKMSDYLIGGSTPSGVDNFLLGDYEK